MLGITGVVLAAATPDAPDSRINALSGSIETVDTPWSGTNYNVRHVITPSGGGMLIITTLSSGSHDDLGARLTVNTGNGDTWVAWWRDGSPDQVIVRRRVNATGVWTPERVQSTATEPSRHPSLAFDGSNAWVAYEADALTGGTTIEAKVIEDDPAPFVIAVPIATTAFTGKVDTLLQDEGGHLWASWVDSATQVGWSSYDYATGFWSVPAFESYADDTVAAARLRIRTTVLGG
jgi:hypothetical protein